MKFAIKPDRDRFHNLSHAEKVRFRKELETIRRFADFCDLGGIVEKLTAEETHDRLHNATTKGNTDDHT